MQDAPLFTNQRITSVFAQDSIQSSGDSVAELRSAVPIVETRLAHVNVDSTATSSPRVDAPHDPGVPHSHVSRETDDSVVNNSDVQANTTTSSTGARSAPPHVITYTEVLSSRFQLASCEHVCPHSLSFENPS